MKKIYLLLLLITPLFAFSQSKRALKKEVKKFRKHYKQEFFEDERSPFYQDKKGMKDMRFFKANRKFRQFATFERTPDSQPFPMATYAGLTKEFVLYGIANVLLQGKEIKVHIYQNIALREMEEYKDHLFIPFKDLTNDDSTYGGGRYIDIKISDIKNGKVLIDFNQCYNPWCAYSDGYNCPIPPVENHFNLNITVGEKMFVGKKRKRRK